MTPIDDFVLRLAVRRGVLGADVAATIRSERDAGSRFGGECAVPLEQVIDRGKGEARALAQAVAAEFSLPWVDLAGRTIPAEVRAWVPREFVLRHQVVPYDHGGGVLRVALADAFAVDLIDDLAHLTGLAVEAGLASAADLRRAIATHYPRAMEAGSGTSSIGAEEDPPTGSMEQDAPVIRLVGDILQTAVRMGASDIHLEPLARRFRVRYRIDGVMLEVKAPPRQWQAAVIARVKIMANISIAEKRVPQDGRIQLALDGRSVDLRVSTMPTTHGESAVLRILESAGPERGLAELGLDLPERARVERLLGASEGLILVTGPTGSGKTTTLYTALRGLNRADRKIITVEDPVEYQLTGINQVPVNPVAGLTFATALRAMLRQAPNVVMVGEVRDRETAEIAINAALTGHLVLSTLHTNDAAGAIARLLDIGAKPFLISAALRAVVAQRLVRRVCAACARPDHPAERDLRAWGISAQDAADAGFRRGAGCPACHGTGFRGRVGIFEVLEVDTALRRLVFDRAGVVALRRSAREAGMRNLREGARSKVLAGLTTIEEVRAVIAGDPGAV